MGRQLTTIERLDGDYPGLRLAVDLLLDHGKKTRDVHALLFERFKVDVPERTIDNYIERRYRPRKERWEESLREKSATLEAIKLHGADAFTEAVILEQIEEAYQRGERASMKDLLREARERERLELEKQTLEIERQRVENEKRALELKIEQTRKGVEEATDEAKAKIEGGKAITPADIDNIRQRTLGLPPKERSAPAGNPA